MTFLIGGDAPGRPGDRVKMEEELMVAEQNQVGAFMFHRLYENERLRRLVVGYHWTWRTIKKYLILLLKLQIIMSVCQQVDQQKLVGEKKEGREEQAGAVQGGDYVDKGKQHLFGFSGQMNYV